MQVAMENGRKYQFHGTLKKNTRLPASNLPNCLDTQITSEITSKVWPNFVMD
jgi:hypothetical protein